MENTVILAGFGLMIIFLGIIGFYIYRINARITQMSNTLEHQFNLFHHAPGLGWLVSPYQVLTWEDSHSVRDHPLHFPAQPGAEALMTR